MTTTQQRSTAREVTEHVLELVPRVEELAETCADFRAAWHRTSDQCSTVNDATLPESGRQTRASDRAYDDLPAATKALARQMRRVIREWNGLQDDLQAATFAVQLILQTQRVTIPTFPAAEAAQWIDNAHPLDIHSRGADDADGRGYAEVLVATTRAMAYYLPRFVRNLGNSAEGPMRPSERRHPLRGSWIQLEGSYIVHFDDDTGSRGRVDYFSPTGDIQHCRELRGAFQGEAPFTAGAPAWKGRCSFLTGSRAGQETERWYVWSDERGGQLQVHQPRAGNPDDWLWGGKYVRAVSGEHIATIYRAWMKSLLLVKSSLLWGHDFWRGSYRDTVQSVLRDYHHRYKRSLGEQIADAVDDAVHFCSLVAEGVVEDLEGLFEQIEGAVDSTVQMVRRVVEVAGDLLSSVWGLWASCVNELHQLAFEHVLKPMAQALDDDRLRDFIATFLPSPAHGRHFGISFEVVLDVCDMLAAMIGAIPAGVTQAVAALLRKVSVMFAIGVEYCRFDATTTRSFPYAYDAIGIGRNSGFGLLVHFKKDDAVPPGSLDAFQYLTPNYTLPLDVLLPTGLTSSFTGQLGINVDLTELMAGVSDLAGFAEACLLPGRMISSAFDPEAQVVDAIDNFQTLGFYYSLPDQFFNVLVAAMGAPTALVLNQPDPADLLLQRLGGLVAAGTRMTFSPVKESSQRSLFDVLGDLAAGLAPAAQLAAREIGTYFEQLGTDVLAFLQCCLQLGVALVEDFLARLSACGWGIVEDVGGISVSWLDPLQAMGQFLVQSAGIVDRRVKNHFDGQAIKDSVLERFLESYRQFLHASGRLPPPWVPGTALVIVLNDKEFTYPAPATATYSPMRLALATARRSPGGITGELRNAINDLGNTFSWAGQVLGSGEFWSDEVGEPFMINALKRIAERSYERVEVLTDARATFADLRSTLQRLNDEDFAIDLFINVHGAGPHSLNNMNCGSTGLCFEGGKATPADISGLQIPNLHAVYLNSCWGSCFNASWLAAGAEGVNGARELNYFVLMSPFQFFHYFLEQELDLESAASRAYEDEQRAFEALYRTMDFASGDDFYLFLSQTYGEDKSLPVQPSASSERRHETSTEGATIHWAGYGRRSG